ncbi:hypothetical protein CEXT_809201 [Caerostris extrusa]|uniref:Uncharacterized protein n=1 Tax=Caerostris extrusa TaxID=172846 RepID=A0AAV4N538_CAEEX|nr:hypothetical protein CEXT_809201 [Caerostris extrusa]
MLSSGHLCYRPVVWSAPAISRLRRSNTLWGDASTKRRFRLRDRRALPKGQLQLYIPASQNNPGPETSVAGGEGSPVTKP